MTQRPKLPIRHVQGGRPEPPLGHVSSNPYLPPQDPPLPEVIEKNSDSVWAMWNEAIEDKAAKDSDTIPATLLMGLPDVPKEPDDD